MLAADTPEMWDEFLTFFLLQSFQGQYCVFDMLRDCHAVSGIHSKAMFSLKRRKYQEPVAVAMQRRRISI